MGSLAGLSLNLPTCPGLRIPRIPLGLSPADLRSDAHFCVASSQRQPRLLSFFFLPIVIRFLATAAAPSSCRELATRYLAINFWATCSRSASGGGRTEASRVCTGWTTLHVHVCERSLQWDEEYDTEESEGTCATPCHLFGRSFAESLPTAHVTYASLSQSDCGCTARVAAAPAAMPWRDILPQFV